MGARCQYPTSHSRPCHSPHEELASHPKVTSAEPPAGIQPALPHRTWPCLGLDSGLRMGKSRATPARTAVSPPFPKPDFIMMGKLKAEAWRARPSWVV